MIQNADTQGNNVPTPEAARLAAKAHGWQTLETSPRDGVVFLSFVPHDQGGFAFSAVWNTSDRLLCMMSGDDFTDKATHWTLLPEFPEND